MSYDSSDVNNAEEKCEKSWCWWCGETRCPKGRFSYRLLSEEFFLGIIFSNCRAINHLFMFVCFSNGGKLSDIDSGNIIVISYIFEDLCLFICIKNTDRRQSWFINSFHLLDIWNIWVMDMTIYFYILYIRIFIDIVI